MRRLAAILLLLVSSARAAAPSIVGVINTPAEVKGTGTTDTITLTAGVAAGHRVGIAFVNEANYSVNAKNISGIVDTKGHTATSRGIAHTSSVHNGEYWDYVVTTPLVAGDTITVTLGSNQDTARGYICFDIAGTATSGQPDVTVVQTTSSFGTTVNTSITTATDNDLIAGLIVFQGDKGYTLGNGTGISSQLLVGFVPASTVGLKIQAFSNVKSPAGAFSPAGTFNVNESAIVIMFAYKPVTTRARYVDLTAGSDAAAGTSTATAWRHITGDTNATGNAASFVPQAGDTFYVKGGSVGSFDVAIKQSGAAGNPITFDGTGVDEFGAAWGSGWAENNLNATYYHAFYSNPAHDYITIKGFKNYGAKNNNNASNVLNNRAGSDQLVTYNGNGDIYCEGGIFNYGGDYWWLSDMSFSEFENCYDRSVLNAENDTDTPNVTPSEIPTTKCAIELYNAADNCTISNVTAWAIGRTAFKLFGARNFLITDCNIGGADGMTNSGWFAVGVKLSGLSTVDCGPGIVQRTKIHDGWQYQGDEAQQRCHAGDWGHLFGSNDGTYSTAGDVHDILFDRVSMYNNHLFSFVNGSSYYFLESDCYNIEWRNCLMVNSFSGGIEARDSDGLTLNFCTIIDNMTGTPGTQPLLLKVGTFHAGPTNVKLRNNIFMTTSANSANQPVGTSGGTYTGPMVDSDYNLYYAPNSGGKPWRWAGTAYDLPAWRTFSGQDAHSKYGSPNFVNLISTANAGSGDYMPAVGSPAIDAGVAVAGISTDFLAASRSQGAGPDFGAIESNGATGGGGSPGPTLQGRLPALKLLRRR